MYIDVLEKLILEKYINIVKKNLIYFHNYVMSAHIYVISSVYSVQKHSNVRLNKKYIHVIYTSTYTYIIDLYIFHSIHSRIIYMCIKILLHTIILLHF